MGQFKEGLKAFTSAARLVVSDEKVRAWYFRRLGLSFLFASFFMIFFVVFLSIFFVWITSWFQSLGWDSTLILAARVGVMILAGLILYFTAGALMLISMSLFFAATGAWTGLVEVLPNPKPLLRESNSEPRVRELARSILLFGLLMVAAVFSLVPFLFWMAIAFSSYAVGFEWLKLRENLFMGEREKITFPLALGYGFIPALTAPFPVLGVFVIPLLQIVIARSAVSEKQGSGNLVPR